MKYDYNIHNRRSIRLKGYDYKQAGAYFVTIVCKHREHLFGNIIDSTMQFNQYGEIVDLHWHNLLKYHQHLQLDTFIIMPNHLHGILILTDDSRIKKRHGLPEIIRGFKTFSARHINRIRRLKYVSVWQRGYYEHIIRNEQSLRAIREYIVNNPLSWEKDELHPNNPCEWDGKIKKLGLKMRRM
ncbi:MAG: transposase [Moorea sp. SIO2B7]|nr:transposase [Moorena sp. SIO2B7]